MHKWTWLSLAEKTVEDLERGLLQEASIDKVVQQITVRPNISFK
jgi:hypothetical protein